MALKYNYNSAERDLSLSEVIDALIEDQEISREYADAILKKKKLSQKHPLISICEVRPGSSEKPKILEELVKWLSHYSKIDYYFIDPLKIDIAKVASILPKAYIKRLNVLPLEIHDHEVIFATAEPFRTAWATEVERIIKKKVKIVLSNPSMIAQCMEDFYAVHRAVKNVHKQGFEKDSAKIKEVENIIGQGNSQIGDDESGVTGIVDWIFQYAQDERATDIHIEPKSGQGIIRFRIDGMLRIVYRFDPEILLNVTSRIKILAGMKVDEKRRPQDGRIKRGLDEDRFIEIRCSCIPTHYGEKIVMRIFDQSMGEKSLEDIGFDELDLKKWKKTAESSIGMILVTGPTGSGKSTTLHGTLRHIAKPEVNICTAEDPVEIINDDFNQVQIAEDVGITFAGAIRAFMRQDPDVIMVGEVRDEETAEMAIQASLTGHTVFSTLHTNDALSTVTRLLELGIKPHLLNATLKGVCSQRLVRLLCPHCKEKVPTPVQLWQNLCAPHSVKMPSHVYTAKGCNQCKNSGFAGRICIYEMVFMNDKLRQAIQSGAELREMQKITLGSFLPIKIHGAKKIIDGLTSIEEVIRVVA